MLEFIFKDYEISVGKTFRGPEYCCMSSAICLVQIQLILI